MTWHNCTCGETYRLTTRGRVYTPTEFIAGLQLTSEIKDGLCEKCKQPLPFLGERLMARELSDKTKAIRAYLMHKVDAPVSEVVADLVKHGHVTQKDANDPKKKNSFASDISGQRKKVKAMQANHESPPPFRDTSPIKLPPVAERPGRAQQKEKLDQVFALVDKMTTTEIRAYLDVIDKLPETEAEAS